MKARTRARSGARPASKARARGSAKPCSETREPAKSESPKAPRKQRHGKAEASRRVSEKEAKEHFVRGVLTRGEAARTRRGKLPPGATHEIVEEPAEPELPKIRRRRFSLV